jgi:pimeloyl-ACP methyl ester carboxylesterase
MPEYVPLGMTRTWYDELGSGEPLLLLHGGLVDARFFDKNIGPLAERFHVHTPDLRGHGHTPDVEGPITHQLMAEDMIAFIETVVGGPVHLVGHSIGAFVAMLVAMQRPDLVRRLVMVSSGFHREGLVADYEFDVDQVVAFLGSSYGEVSPDGEEHFRVVAEKIHDMVETGPALARSELSAVTQRTLVMFADDDLVTGQHMIDLFEGISDAELAIVPGTSHRLLQEKPELCNTMIVDFLTTDPVPTIAPIRRAGA